MKGSVKPGGIRRFLWFHEKVPTDGFTRGGSNLEGVLGLLGGGTFLRSLLRGMKTKARGEV